MSASSWDDPTEMLTRAQQARAQGDQPLAYQLYARASEISPQEGKAWQGRAETAASADEALVSYAYAAALQPDAAALARTLDAAIAQKVQDSQPGDAALLAALGQELAEVGLDEGAQALLERAVELDPSSTDALVWLAGISGEDQKQLDYLNRALAVNPHDARARAGLLAVKLPGPPAPAAPPGAGAPFSGAAPQLRLGVPLAMDPAAPENSTMEGLRKRRQAAPATVADVETTLSDDPALERLRRLRETVPQAAPPRAAMAAASESDARLRMILLLLVALVVILAAAGLYLILTQ